MTGDLNVIFVCGPGHGGPAVVASTYLEGIYTELYPHITRDEDGLRKLFRQFSFPGGIPSHAASTTPGSINEGGELGYSLVHAYGAVFDNPDLIAACVIGDGEAETGALATSWHSNKFLDPVRDGTVLPILHLNGWKIANPTVLARIDEDDLRALLEGYGYEVHVVAGSEPEPVHQQLAETLDTVIARIHEIQADARARPSVGGAAPLADDRAAHTERVDGAEGRRRRTGRRNMAFPPGAARGSRHESRAPRDARVVDEELSPRRAVRRARRGSCARSPRLLPTVTAAWVRTRTRTAGCCSAISSYPTSARTQSTYRPMAVRRWRGRTCSARGCAT